jgi:hypothetical protein
VCEEESDEEDESQEPRRGGRRQEKREEQSFHHMSILSCCSKNVNSSFPIEAGAVYQLAIDFLVPDPDHVLAGELLGGGHYSVVGLLSETPDSAVVGVVVGEVVLGDHLGEFFEGHFVCSVDHDSLYPGCL